MKLNVPVFAMVVALMILPWSVASHGQSIGLAPAQVVQTFKPGVPFEFELTTVNSGSSAVEMNVQLTDFWYNEKNEKIFPAPGTAPRSATNWIQFVPEHFNVEPGATQKMRAIVTPPADAKGGYYAVLFVESKPQLSFDKTEDGKSVFTNMRIGCLVLLTAEHTDEYKVELSELEVKPPSEKQSFETRFELLNSGNSHIFPVARVAVLDSQNKLVAKAESEMKRYLPGQKDAMRVNWAGTLPAGDYNAVLTVAYGEEGIETRQIPFHVQGQ